MGIVIAIIIFGLIVTVHEFGHFICAKLSGIRVLEFAIGMGPKIIQKKKGETMYSLRLLPIGGYCAMEGEDETTADSRGFRNAALWKRMIVLFAGPFMNFIMGFILLVVMAGMMDSVMTTKVSGFRYYVDPDSGQPVYCARSVETGLKKGDQFIKIDGTRIFSFVDLNFIFGSAKTDTHDVVVKRDGEKVELEGVVFRDTQLGDMVDFGLEQEKKNVLTVTKSAGNMFLSMTHVVGISLKQLATGKVEKEEMSGPVGVVSTINEVATESEDKEDTLFNLLYLTSLITINVGIFNLLPIPGLDGGRLLFCLIELVRRKPVKPEHEGYVHLAGMVLLFGIMIFVTYNDIVRLITGG